MLKYSWAKERNTLVFFQFTLKNLKGSFTNYIYCMGWGGLELSIYLSLIKKNFHEGRKGQKCAKGVWLWTSPCSNSTLHFSFQRDIISYCKLSVHWDLTTISYRWKGFFTISNGKIFPHLSRKVKKIYIVICIKENS